MTAASLAGHLLIAMPSLSDPNFRRSVVLVGSHSLEEGAFGLVMNRPSEVQFADVMSQLGVPLSGPRLDVVYCGGPVEPNQGFVVVEGALPEDDPHSLFTGDFTISGRSDLLAGLAGGALQRQFALCLGYAGWQAGQLERELEENSWLLAPATRKLVFGTAVDDRWRAALASIGVQPGTLVDSRSGAPPS